MMCNDAVLVVIVVADTVVTAVVVVLVVTMEGQTGCRSATTINSSVRTVGRTKTSAPERTSRNAASTDTGVVISQI